MTPEAEGAWQRAQRILCIRLDALGDLLMTAPAIRCLKEGREDRQITLLTSPAGQPAAAFLPGVDETLVYEAPWMKASAKRDKSSGDWEFWQSLRAREFDAALIFTVFSQNPLPAALMCYAADIPLRAAYCRENPYQLLSAWLPETEPEQGIRHEVKRHLDLVAALGCSVRDERMKLQLPAEAQLLAESIGARIGLDMRKPWIILHPGATAASRRYPPQKFAAVARRLRSDHGLQIVVTGSEGERELWSLMQKELPREGIFELFGALSFLEFCSLIANAELLLSNNSGPVHIASSLGTAVVDLYALTNPQHTPWLVPHRVLNKDVPCRYCFKSVCPQGHNNCLSSVSVDEVVDAVLDLQRELKELPKPRSLYDVHAWNQCRIS